MSDSSSVKVTKIIKQADHNTFFIKEIGQPIFDYKEFWQSEENYNKSRLKLYITLTLLVLFHFYQ